MLADRSFTLFERKLKTKETIVLREEYDEMIREVENLYFLNSVNFPVRECKAATSGLLKVRPLIIYIHFL